MIDPSLFENLPLIADGDPLHGLESPGPSLPEAEVLEAPGKVQARHRAYAMAGARVLRTLTSGADPEALARNGLSERGEAIHVSGHALARGALETPGAIMAPFRPPILPANDSQSVAPNTIDWERHYGERIVYLSDAGVDFFVLEHFDREKDANILIRLIKTISDAPVMGLLRNRVAGRNPGTPPLRETAFRLAEAGADALGLSCASPRDDLAACLESLAAPGLPLAVLAAGHTPDGANLDPQEFAARIAPLARDGVSILGGCCGTSPAHIAALASAVHSRV